MGLSPSKRAENVLKNSASFREAIATIYHECVAFTEFPGLRLYQLPDACSKIYTLLSLNSQVPAVKFRQTWLPQPPTQLQIDQTLRNKNLISKTSLNLEEFEAFALALFRDMAISNAWKAMAWYIPVGFAVILCSHVTVQRVPKIGPRYRTLDSPLPKAMASYTAATAATLYYKLGT